MSLLDIVDIFSNLSKIGDKEHGPKRPKVYILFYGILIPSIFWFLIEWNSIMNMPSPILFLGLTFTGGLILTIATIVLIYKLGLIEALKPHDFFSILIPVTLMTISFVSFIAH
jgi:hypothetical protein